MAQHRSTSGALAGDGDPTGIATELRDIVLDPLKGQRLIKQAAVHRRIRSFHVTKPVKAHAVADKTLDRKSVV